MPRRNQTSGPPTWEEVNSQMMRLATETSLLADRLRMLVGPFDPNATTPHPTEVYGMTSLVLLESARRVFLEARRPAGWAQTAHNLHEAQNLPSPVGESSGVQAAQIQAAINAVGVTDAPITPPWCTCRRPGYYPSGVPAPQPPASAEELSPETYFMTVEREPTIPGIPWRVRGAPVPARTGLEGLTEIPYSVYPPLPAQGVDEHLHADTLVERGGQAGSLRGADPPFSGTVAGDQGV